MTTQPPVWKKLGEAIHQDFMLDNPDFWSGILMSLPKILRKRREKK